MNYIDSKVIINYPPQCLTEASLKALFSECGTVVKDRNTKISLGYGFVEYNNSDAAAKSILKFNGHRIGSKMIKVSYSRQSRPDIRNANLYIGQLPNSYNQHDLERLFSQYGSIISCNMSARNKGVGFVRFNTNQEAERARVSLNGMTPSGHDQPLVVEYSTYKIPHK